MKAADGHVFQKVVKDEKEMEALRNSYSIVNSVYGEEGYRVKFISKSDPDITNAVRAEISLEDAYIYLSNFSDS